MNKVIKTGLGEFLFCEIKGIMRIMASDGVTVTIELEHKFPQNIHDYDKDYELSNECLGNGGNASTIVEIKRHNGLFKDYESKSPTATVNDSVLSFQSLMRKNGLSFLTNYCIFKKKNPNIR